MRRQRAEAVRSPAVAQRLAHLQQWHHLAVVVMPRWHAWVDTALIAAILAVELFMLVKS